MPSPLKRLLSAASAGLLAYIAGVSAAAPAPHFVEGHAPELGGQHFVPVPELSDEFDADELNLDKWVRLDGNWPGRPPGIFDAASVSVRDGQLWITADRFDDPIVLHGQTWTHRGGLVGSQVPAQVGTYTEARMKVNATFMSSTFWLMAYPTDTPDGRRSVELDVVECVGVDSREHPDDPWWTKQWDQHYWLSIRNQGPSPDTALSQAQIAVGGNGDITEHWRTFACWWKSETEIWFYIDGKRVAVLNPGLPFDIPMRLRMVVETYDHNPPPEKGAPGSVFHPDGTKLSVEERSTRYEYVRTWRVGSAEDADVAPAAAVDAAAAPAADSAAADRFPTVRIAHTFAPPGESNVRSSFRLADGVALIGTEETGDIYKTTDAGQSWRKTIDTDERWEVSDVRNFIRAQDGAIYATTSEPATILRSSDEGETWGLLARPAASRTVALVQLDGGAILAGLRRSENNKISLVRSEDGFATHETVVLSPDLPRQNVTCLSDLGGGVVLAGIGYEESGKVFRSVDAGRTWTQTADFPNARDLMNFFRVDDRVYVMASGIATLYVSDDAGVSWSRSHQVWEKGFLGQSATLDHGGQRYRLLAATDQREKPVRHVVLISDDAGATWHEWIELARDHSGGASNLAVIDDGTVIVGTGNHAVQGFAYTLAID